MLKINKEFNSAALLLAALILYLILISSTASAAIEQSAMPAGTYAYIANNENVLVIDTATNHVVATVHVGFASHGVAVMPDGKKVYVTHYFPVNNVSVIDTSTNTVIATVPVGVDPLGIAITPDGTKAYVTNYGTGSLVNFDDKLNTSTDVFVIDTATNTVIATVPVGGRDVGVAITPDGKKVYVTNSMPVNNVSVIDTATNTVTATVPVEGNPVGVAVTPDGTKAYVVSQGTNSVFVIDTSTNNVIAIVPVGASPEGIAISPDGTKVYVTNSFNGNIYNGNFDNNNSNKSTVSVIDTARDNVIANIYVGGQPFGISVTPDGKKVFVANRFDNNVSVINTETNNVIAKIKVKNQTVALGQFIGSIPAQTDKDNSQNATAIENGKQPEAVNETLSKSNTSILEQNTSKAANSQTGGTKTPGFEFICGTFSLLAVFLYKIKRES
jgi:YVTN family beta-propeller protein